MKLAKKWMGGLALAIAAMQVPAVAQEVWEPEFDLITAGAAASVILHHVCLGQEAGAAAAEYAAKRLVRESARVQAAEQATTYARESYRTKLKAFEQTTSGESCRNLRRLFDIAAYTDFPVPMR